MPTDEVVKRAVDSEFPESERSSVMTALRGYRWKYEQQRVRLAILVLAYGKLSEVERLVAAANEDYRDLLYWAEYPVESGAGTKAEMANRYRQLGVRVPTELT